MSKQTYNNRSSDIFAEGERESNKFANSFEIGVYIVLKALFGQMMAGYNYWLQKYGLFYYVFPWISSALFQTTPFSSPVGPVCLRHIGITSPKRSWVFAFYSLPSTKYFLWTKKVGYERSKSKTKLRPFRPFMPSVITLNVR